MKKLIFLTVVILLVACQRWKTEYAGVEEPTENQPKYSLELDKNVPVATDR
jgi:hypothetical protein